MIVDCVSQPLPAKAGVGLARKIGTDIALRLQSTGQVASPWLYQSDADAQLPANYFDERGHNLCDKQGAVVFGHRHYSTDASLTRAVRLYEKHMQYYVTGLAQAGSTYAYPSLGSTIAIHSISYAAVRGYPQRNAAEDFYLLNKIAKVHGVVYLPRTVVSLAARLSDRGTLWHRPSITQNYRRIKRKATTTPATSVITPIVFCYWQRLWLIWRISLTLPARQHI